MHYLIFILLLAISAPAQLPDWLTTGAELTLEYSKVTSGGLRSDSAVLGNMDLTLSADLGDGTAFLYVLGNDGHGGPPSALVGDIQATSNIEAPDTWKLYEAWYEHNFGAWTILGGLHDYNGEFDVLEYGQLFNNSSFGIGPDVSQVGPSIFPTTALALRLRIEPCSISYLQVAVYDGVPGDPDNENRTQVILGDGDGQFYASEFGISDDAERYYKLAVGAWYRSASDEGGGYLLAESATWDGGPGLFLRLGAVRDRGQQVGRYIGAGFNWAGFGLGVAHARFGDDFASSDFAHAETAVELTYAVQLHERASVQPFLQFVRDPGSEPDIEDAVLLGFRLGLALW
jgi:porin